MNNHAEYAVSGDFLNKLFFFVFYRKICYSYSMAEKIINVELDSQTADAAESILNRLGLTSEQAAKIFFTQIVLKKAIPFTISLGSDTAAVNDEASESDADNSSAEEKTSSKKSRSKRTVKKHVIPEIAENLDLTPSKSKGAPDLETGVVIKKQMITILEQEDTEEETSAEKEEKPKAKKTRSKSKKTSESKKKSGKTGRKKAVKDTEPEPQIEESAEPSEIQVSSEEISVVPEVQDTTFDEPVIEETGVDLPEENTEAEPEIQEESEVQETPAQDDFAIEETIAEPEITPEEDENEEITVPVPEETEASSEVPAETPEEPEEKPAKKASEKKKTSDTSGEDTEEEDDADTDESVPDNLFDKWDFGENA